MLYVWKENSMLTNCLAACAHLSITVSEIQRDICKKSAFYHTPLHSTSEYRHPLWYGKTRMVSLPDGEKISNISLFVLAQLTNVTDAQTDRRTDGHRVTAYTALMHMHRAVKIEWATRDHAVIAASVHQRRRRLSVCVEHCFWFKHCVFSNNYDLS